MATAAKTAAVAEIRDAFTNSTAAVLTEYRGLTVAQLRELRRTLAGNATYAVVKNTLTKIAASDAGIPGFDALLQGPSAIAFVSGDPVTVAKGIRDFSRTNPLLVIKGGVLDGRAMSADEIRRLADVESREVLLARLAGGLLASLSGAVSLIAAPLSQAARLLAALQARAGADPGVLRGDGDTTSAAESGPATPGDEPPADDAAAGELAAESPAPEPAPTDATPEPATSGDAADAAVAADALAREVAAEDVAAEDVTVEQPPAEQPPDEEPPA